MSERFSRTELLLGPDAVERLASCRVLVAGLGAVGSYAVEGLARAGVGSLRLVDFDVVQPSNINRQLYAMDSTVGKPKVELAQTRVLDINPDCRVEALCVFVDEETLPALLEGPPHVVIDAIDSLNPKVNLLQTATLTTAHVISSMGAASRTDPAYVRVGDLWTSHGCPLARLIRKRLRRRGCKRPIHCIYSTEPPSKPGVDEATVEQARPEHFHRGRPRRPLGSFSCLTGMFGLMAASEAISHLLGERED